MKIRDEEAKHVFLSYLNEHPDERFWQSVYNFACIVSGEYIADVAVMRRRPGLDWEDPFYWEQEDWFGNGD